MKTKPWLFAVLLAGASIAHAEVTVSDAWARDTRPGQKSAGVYMKLKSDQDVKLVGAGSPAARTVEIHEMAMVDNVMKMRAVDALALPPGRVVELKPGGFHVMLIDIGKPLAAGDKVPLTLNVIDKAGKASVISVTAEVRTGASADDHSKHKH